MRISTPKVKPAPGAREEQRERQRPPVMGKIGALAVTAALGVAAVALSLGSWAGETTTIPADAPPTAAPGTDLGPFGKEGRFFDEVFRATKVTLSPEQNIGRAGDSWAALFAASRPAACKLMTQPACEQMNCERINEPIRDCTPPSSEFRRSFDEATVRDIAVNGDQAAARFSNGETVQLEHASGYAVGGVWLIRKLGGSAGREFFE